MSRNRGTSHLVWGYAEWLASVEVVVRNVGFFGPHVYPVLVKKNRSQRRLLYGRLPGENLLLLGIAYFSRLTLAQDYPVAKTVPGKPGYVYSPFDGAGGMIDVTGYAPGTKVKDPDTKKIFIVP